MIFFLYTSGLSSTVTILSANFKCAQNKFNRIYPQLSRGTDVFDYVIR
jgi:hypothetical protein